MRLMRTFILTLAILFIVLNPVVSDGLFSGTAKAKAGESGEQRSAFDSAFAGYKDARDIYSAAKQEMGGARGRAQQKLLEKAKAFMLNADEAAIMYLDVLKGRIEQVQGLPDDKREEMLSEIQADSEWLLKSQSDIKNADNMNELRVIAKQLREHWRNYRGVSKRMAGLVLHEKLAVMITRAEDASTRIRKLNTALKSRGKDTGRIEILLEEFDGHVAAAKQKNDAAKALFESIPGAGDANSSFKEGMEMIRGAHRELKEAHSDLIDINKELKSAVKEERSKESL